MNLGPELCSLCPSLVCLLHLWWTSAHKSNKFESLYFRTWRENCHVWTRPIITFLTKKTDLSYFGKGELLRKINVLSARRLIQNYNFDLFPALKQFPIYWNWRNRCWNNWKSCQYGKMPIRVDLNAFLMLESWTVDVYDEKDIEVLQKKPSVRWIWGSNHKVTTFRSNG